eukprot:scaffold234_cov406-Prasinococcus_capsulatus_cf.AAC.2
MLRAAGVLSGCDVAHTHASRLYWEQRHSIPAREHGTYGSRCNHAALGRAGRVREWPRRRALTEWAGSPRSERPRRPGAAVCSAREARGKRERERERGQRDQSRARRGRSTLDRHQPTRADASTHSASTGALDRGPRPSTPRDAQADAAAFRSATSDGRTDGCWSACDDAVPGVTPAPGVGPRRATRATRCLLQTRADLMIRGGLGDPLLLGGVGTKP